MIELAMGRQMWGVGGIPGIWSGDINSEHNSQYLFDPYTLTHLIHGVILYALLTIAFPRATLAHRLLAATGLECGWEIIENTSFIIDRYRTETISLNYYGDSVFNSMFDIVACMTGFFLASRFPRRVTVAGVVAIELLLLVWTRDNLTLNIIMLLHPIRAIRVWQLAR